LIITTGTVLVIVVPFPSCPVALFPHAIGLDVDVGVDVFVGVSVIVGVVVTVAVGCGPPRLALLTTIGR
jgi:hypothetical protein